jgi:FixJ family two-component response regulator
LALATASYDARVGGRVPEDRLISIVDDDASVREALRALVRSLGYKAATFSSAELFLQSEVIAETACLITDLQMPGMGGLELQEELRSRGCRTPVIVITAYPDEKQRTRALNAGAVGFLSKPFDDEALIGCLTAAIRRSN